MNERKGEGEKKKKKKKTQNEVIYIMKKVTDKDLVLSCFFIGHF